MHYSEVDSDGGERRVCRGDRYVIPIVPEVTARC